MDLGCIRDVSGNSKGVWALARAQIYIYDIRYTIYIRYRPNREFSVFLGVSPGKAFCARTTIFSVLHTICVSSVSGNFGLCTATIRSLLRDLKIAIFEYSCKSCITTWQAEIFF